MKKAEKILEKHIVLNDCIGYLGSDGRLYKAIIDALEEAMNHTRCCTTLPTKKIMNFDDWVKFLKWEQVGNSYVYKQGNKYKDANELKQAHSTYLRI